VPCPLYLGLTSGNPLKVCGLKERSDHAPSSAHVKIVCLSGSAYIGCPLYKIKTINWKVKNRWSRFFKQLFGFFYQERRKEMECPVCGGVFPKFKEVLMIVDRVFYCHHCCSRLISYPDGEGSCIVEDDCTGEKWMAVEKAAFAMR